MTTEIQIEGLVFTLETDDPLSLGVKGQPVVGVFEDSTTKEKDSLGRVDQEMSKLFIALATWIGPRRSRNNNNKTGRLMLLVVPAETLTLESACDDYDYLAKQLPTNAFDEPSDNKSGKCKLLRMSFEIDSLRSLQSLFVRTLGLSTSHTMCMALPNTNHKRLAFGSH
jgi:hypothetical protein